ncbi:MAG: hypothetical protein ACO1RA_17160 [Planctomycetaceae bacterium]
MIELSAWRFSVIVGAMIALVSSMFPPSIPGDEPAPKSANIEEWEKEIKAFSDARRRLLSKAEGFLESKRLKERIARQDDPLAIVEMSAEEWTKYHLAQRSIREMFVRAPEIASQLCLHLEERELPVASSRARASYVEGFPSARTLSELDPRTAKSVANVAGSCDTPQMQYLIGALLNDLDGIELAKARLDIKIKELTSSEKAEEERFVKAIANLRAVRKLFDKKGVFQLKRI